MHLNLSRISILAVLALAACGGDDDGGNTPIDAPAAIDAPIALDAAAVTNALGQVCTFGAAGTCPTGNSCTGLQGVGSTTMGYCSPVCTMAGGECAAGYTGPAGGMPQCALSTAQGAPPSLCAIVCTVGTQCPTGLACVPVPGQPQPVSVCAPAA